MQKWWIVQNSPQPGLRSRSKRTGDSCQSVLALIISSLTPLNLIFPSWVIYSSSSSTVMISLFLSLEPLELLPLFSLPLMSSCCFLSTASKSDPSNSFANLRDSEITATSFLSMGHSCFSATFSLTVSSCRFARGWTAAVSELFRTAFAESSIRFFEIARVVLNLGSALFKLVRGLLRSFGGCIFAKLPSLLVTLMSTALNGDFVKDFAGLAGGISNSVRLSLFFSLACAAFLSIASLLLSFFFCPVCTAFVSTASLLLAQEIFCGQKHDARLNPIFLSLGLSSAFGWSISLSCTILSLSTLDRAKIRPQKNGTRVQDWNGPICNVKCEPVCEFLEFICTACFHNCTAVIPLQEPAHNAYLHHDISLWRVESL